MQQLERVRSASNLRQIGLATLMYGNAEKNNGAVSVAGPPFFLKLKTQDLSPDAFIATTQPGLHGENTYAGATKISNGGLTVSSPGAADQIFVDTNTASYQQLAAVAGKRVTTPLGNRNLPRDIYDSVLLPTAGDSSFTSTPSVAAKDGQLRSSIATGDAKASSPPTVQPTSGGIGVTLGIVSAPNKPGETLLENDGESTIDHSAVTPGLSRNRIAAANLKRDEEEKENTSAIAPPVVAADAPAATTPPSPASAPDENAVISRKIIREGEMTFEIDSFDSTVMNIGKIVAEEGGFVSTTDSDKLANGKVKGTVVVRVPPDHLDTLVLKLRGIGDLKSQKITAQDITKQYTDLESELRAAQAMQERLLDIIKNGKGAVKDLLEAEKQLGVWREKIEQVEGELRYDNNLVSLSTLSISLIKRDIKSAAFSSINEQVTMALETEKVEEAYNATREAIDNAKGRIIQSELKQYDAGQFGSNDRTSFRRMLPMR